MKAREVRDAKKRRITGVAQPEATGPRIAEEVAQPEATGLLVAGEAGAPGSSSRLVAAQLSLSDTTLPGTQQQVGFLGFQLPLSIIIHVYFFFVFARPARPMSTNP